MNLIVLFSRKKLSQSVRVHSITLTLSSCVSLSAFMDIPVVQLIGSRFPNFTWKLVLGRELDLR